MKPVIVSLIDEAAEEYERLTKIVEEEKEKGIPNSEKQQLLNGRYHNIADKKCIITSLTL